MVGGALLRPPTSFSLCNWPGGAVHAAPAGLLSVVSLSGGFSTALAGVAPSSCARACWAAWAPRATAARSFADSAVRSTAGRGCSAVCGMLRAPVLRALAGASHTASLAMALGLKIEEHKLRTTGMRN